MHKYLTIILWLTLLIPPLSAQMVTTDPVMPVMGKPVKIYYDTSKDAGDLHNFTGDLYAHTGITVDGTDWKNVLGTWGNNSSQPRLTYLGNYIYQLEISPDISTFYNLSYGTVTKICLVFRNSSANFQTRPDIFITVFGSGLNVSVLLPEKFSLVTDLNRHIPVKAAAVSADSVTLYINNNLIKSGKTADLVTDTIVADTYGEFWVKAVAWDKPAFAADSFFIYVRRPLVTEELPPGLKDGINYTGSSSVTLVLHAPYKNFVFATGDFTDWLPRDMGYMKRTPDSQRYWLEINGLGSGKEYRFQYLVDTSLYIADPYAEKILDPWNDQYISASTYPGLLGYPSDTASGIVSVLQTNRIPYTWKTTGFTPPEKSGLMIYELLLRDFLARHDFRTLIDTLSYLDDLGINAVELMPVNEFEGNLSWGYNPSFYFAVDKYYGPAEYMKAFVDSCHARGIAVIMDIVLNHTMGQSPFVQLYLDHFGTDQIYMKTPNPWFNASSPNTFYKWGADFNHESVSTQKLVDRINAFWLTEYKIDGFRFDFTKGFTNTPGEGTAYDASRIAILKRMANQIWALNQKAYVILEHFAAPSEEKELADYGIMLWGNSNGNYRDAAKGLPSDLSFSSYKGRGWTSPRLVTYMESHDEERLMFSVLNEGSSNGSYNTRNLQTALKRMELNTVFFLTIPGPKMIWQFGESGYDISINDGGRTGEKPIKWDYLSNPDRHRLYMVYRLLNNLRKTEPVFSSDDFTWSLSSFVKRLQLNHPTMNVNIVGNFDLTASSIDPEFQMTGKWFEYFSGDSVIISDVNEAINLQPGEYRLYSTKKMALSGLITGVNDVTAQKEPFSLTAYPNPSAGPFYFRVQDEILFPLSVQVYDFTGRKIRGCEPDFPVFGNQGFLWDGRSDEGSEAPDGIYYLRVSNQQFTQTIRVLKLR